MPDVQEQSDEAILNSLAQPGSVADGQIQRLLQYRARLATVALTDAVRVTAGAIAKTADNLKTGAGDLAKKLDGMVDTIESAAGRLEDKADKVSTGLGGLAESFHWAAERLHAVASDASARYDAFARSQARQQQIVLALTIVIAASTASYTWITWKSVVAQRQGNEIQRQLLELQKRPSAANPASRPPATAPATPPK